MRIGYEAKRAFLNMTGLGNYSRGVIGMMAANYPDNKYLLYTPYTGDSKRTDFLNQYKHVKTVTPRNQLFTWWWRGKGVVNDLKRDGIGLYHGLSHELPIGIHQTGIKTVVTIHDLIFMRFPQYFGYISRKIYAAKIGYACKHADQIIAISERTKADMIKILHVDPARIEVIYQTCDAIFKAGLTAFQKETVRLKYELPDEFILNVGTIEPRKNLMLLVKAMALLPDNIKLVVIGRPTAYMDHVRDFIDRNTLSERVLFIEDVGYNELPAIYQSASLFVYPSLYEGFGIPVLEALVSRVPVIAAKGSCLEEAGGPDSIYVDPDDELELSKKINLVLNDGKLRHKMIERGVSYSQRFDDKLLAGQLMGLYEKVTGNA